MGLGEKLHEVAFWRGKTQKELAALLGIPYTTLNGYFLERNKLPIETAVKLSKILDVSLYVLLDEEPFPAASTDSLSEDENQIIVKYRKLYEDQKKIISLTLDLYINQNKEKK